MHLPVCIILSGRYATLTKVFKLYLFGVLFLILYLGQSYGVDNGLRYHQYFLALYVQQMFPSLRLHVPYIDSFCNLLVLVSANIGRYCNKISGICIISNNLMVVTCNFKIQDINNTSIF